MNNRDIGLIGPISPIDRPASTFHIKRRCQTFFAPRGYGRRDTEVWPKNFRGSFCATKNPGLATGDRAAFGGFSKARGGRSLDFGAIDEFGHSTSFDTSPSLDPRNNTDLFVQLGNVQRRKAVVITRRQVGATFNE